MHGGGGDGHVTRVTGRYVSRQSKSWAGSTPRRGTTAARAEAALRRCHTALGQGTAHREPRRGGHTAGRAGRATPRRRAATRVGAERKGAAHREQGAPGCPGWGQARRGGGRDYVRRGHHGRAGSGPHRGEARPRGEGRGTRRGQGHAGPPRRAGRGRAHAAPGWPACTGTGTPWPGGGGCRGGRGGEGGGRAGAGRDARAARWAPHRAPPRGVGGEAALGRGSTRRAGPGHHGRAREREGAAPG
jgi:hypothetical protein